MPHCGFTPASFGLRLRQQEKLEAGHAGQNPLHSEVMEVAERERGGAFVVHALIGAVFNRTLTKAPLERRGDTKGGKNHANLDGNGSHRRSCFFGQLL